jgi:hypothetical protein
MDLANMLLVNALKRHAKYQLQDEAGTAQAILDAVVVAYLSKL